jgi:phosphopentomutase
MLIITADHGCDPTTPSTDHSREYTPLLVYGHQVAADRNLGTRGSLADIGQTVAENFGAGAIPAGTSFLQDIQKG